MLVHDRNPESMRTVPRVCAAGRDSVSAESAACVFFRLFFEKSAPGGKSLETLIPGYLEDTFWAPENFPVFFISQPP